MYRYIIELSEKWFISWFWDETFRPYTSITRSEFLKLIFLVSNTTLSNDTKDYFFDIKVGWQKKYINTWVHLWIVSTQNKNFYPNGSITRVEAIKIIVLLFVWEIPNNYSKNIWDISWWEWYVKYVEYALNNNFFTLKENKFFPNQNITRYEVVNILKKIQNK